jgi:general secretion pathway protein K
MTRRWAQRSVGRRRRERGIALVTTVWVSLFLALTAASILASVRTDSSARRNAADLVRARELAKAGLHLAIHEIGLPVAERTMPRDGRVVALGLAGGALDIAIEDERGKLDLRLAAPQHVQALLRAIGGRSGVDAFDAVNLAQQLAAAIDAGQAGDARVSKVHSISALTSVPGVSAEVLAALSRHATIFGFGAQVNPLTASREVLLAIEGVDARVADGIIGAREQGRPRPAAGRAESSFTNIEGPIYTVRATGRLPNGIEASVTGVVGSAGIGLASRKATVSILELR